MPQKIPDIHSMPILGLGTWELLGKACTNAIKMALDLGYRHIDTADVYHNHQAIAEGIIGFPREQLYIVSKIAEQNLAPKLLASTCERLLKELKTPYLDQLLIHWPWPAISAESSLAEMVRLQERNLVRHIGVSNFYVEELQRLEKFHLPIFANQIQLHPYLQEKALVEYCQQQNIAVVAYSPIKPVRIASDPILKEIGETHSKTPIQVVLRWIIQRNIAVIPKASSYGHLKENIELFDFALSHAEMSRIATLDRT